MRILKLLSKVFRVDKNNDSKMHSNGLDLIKIFKGLTIPIINSAIGLVPIGLLFKISDAKWIFTIYFIVLILHLGMYFGIYNFSELE